MSIGNRIKTIRKARGWTKTQLAKKSGVATITVSQYETGKRQPRLEQLQSIAEALGVSWFYLSTGKPYDTVEQAMEEYGSLKITIASSKILITLLEAMYGKSRIQKMERTIENRKLGAEIRTFYEQSSPFSLTDENITTILSAVNGVISSLVKDLRLDEKETEWHLEEELDRDEAIIRSGFDFDNMKTNVRFRVTGIKPLEID